MFWSIVSFYLLNYSFLLTEVDWIHFLFGLNTSERSLVETVLQFYLLMVALLLWWWLFPFAELGNDDDLHTLQLPKLVTRENESIGGSDDGGYSRRVTSE